MASTMTVRDINLEIVRNAMKGKSAVSRAEAAAITGLSFPTVSKTLELLCQSGEAERVGSGESVGGRRAALYRLNPLFSVSLLVRVERGHISWKGKDLEGKTLLEGEEEIKGKLLEQLGKIGLRVKQRYPQLKAAVIGVAGMVCAGKVILCNGDKELEGVNLEGYLTGLMGIPVKAVNDMNAAAAGWWSRRGQKTGSCVCIYLGGNGIGAGCILDGRLWQGTGNFAGELSFLPDIPKQLRPFDMNRGLNDILLDTYRRIIQIYSAVLNPERIVLYRNVYLDEGMKELSCACERAIPRYSMPRLELSGEYLQDYEQGLAALTRRAAEEGA